MGRRKARNIKIREDRLSQIDETKMEVAIWLLAKGEVEDRTQRGRPVPPAAEGVNQVPLDGGQADQRDDTPEAA